MKSKCRLVQENDDRIRPILVFRERGKERKKPSKTRRVFVERQRKLVPLVPDPDLEFIDNGLYAASVIGDGRQGNIRLDSKLRILGPILKYILRQSVRDILEFAF